MKPQDIMREAAASVGWSHSLLAEKMGYNSKSAVSNIFNHKTMKFDTFIKFMDLMGYEVIVKSKSRDNKNTWVVTNEEADT